MEQVVKAVCPGCRNSLRIPATWLNQPLKCRHCQMVFAAKAPAAVPASAPVNKRTPAPPTKPSSPAAIRPAPVAQIVPPTAQQAGRVMAPVAIPVPTPAANAAFAGLGNPAPSPPPAPRRKGSGGLWKGVMVALSVLVLAGVAAIGFGAFALGKLKERPKATDTQVAQNGDDKDKVPATQPAPPETTKPKDTAPPKDTKPATPPPATTKPAVKPPATTAPVKPPPTTRPAPVEISADKFPRRALVIGVHNYLYANPVGSGPRLTNARNVEAFVTKLGKSLCIPIDQLAHLSDAAKTPRAPTKPVIQDTLASFLSTSRAQDRILVFFSGHAVEKDDKAYLVPIEGDLETPATLIPLEEVYASLAACKARQKILVLDVARFNPTVGQERPGGDPLGKKFAEIVSNPPAGVQVWSACSAEERSYETETAQMGVFLDSLCVVLDKDPQGKSQKPEDLLVLDTVNEAVTQQVSVELKGRNVKQTPTLKGSPPAEGAAYDASAARPPQPVIATPPDSKGNVALIKGVLEEVGTPPVKPGQYADSALRFELLPAMDAKVMEKYPAAESKLKAPIEKARATLYAVASQSEPSDLKPQVQEIRGQLKMNLSVMKDGYKAPGGGQQENQFKDRVKKDQEDMARIIGRIQAAYDELVDAGAEMDAEPPRWQANYLFMKARMEAQLAYLIIYSAQLGSMRKEFPPRDPAQHTGWRLAATTDVSGDGDAKKKAKSAHKTFDELIEKYAGTPWEILARREKLTALGLEWQPSKEVK